MSPELYVGLMSGTSLDGVDAVLAQFDEHALQQHASYFLPYDEDLRRRVLMLQQPQHNELDCAALLALDLAQLYAECVNSLLHSAKVEARNVRAIGCHGQTVRHRPERGYTIQLVNGAALAERAGVTVICDFRSRDLAAGGQGAPLVPAFHAALFCSRNSHRVIVNIGGIANITELSPSGPVRGFDCGPGNMLIDAWARKHIDEAYDANGDWARSGKLIARLLERWLSHPFFAAPAPKSTGRELFQESWITDTLASKHPAQDVQRTLVELTARTIADSVRRECRGASELYICGGGVHNTFLCERLEACLGEITLGSTAKLGVDPDWVEALAFAWLARQTLLGLPGNISTATGARGSRILGAIYQT